MPSSSLLQKGMKLSHLRVMAALAETGQIGLAAARLGITQPAASRLMAEIEHILGQPIHVRTGRGIALTAAGTALARRAQRVQLEMRDAERELAEIANGGAGHVRIGSVTGPALELVLPVIRTSRLSEPGVSVEVTVATSDLLCQQLLAGQVDFAIGRLPDGADRARIETRVIAPEPVSLVVRRGHRLDGAPGLTAEALLHYDWVMPGPDTLLRRAVVDRLAALGLPQPPQRLSTASFLLTLAVLQQSNAIAPLATAVAEVFARPPDAPYAIVPIDLEIEVEAFGLMRRAGGHLPPAAARIAKLILARAERGARRTRA